MPQAMRRKKHFSPQQSSNAYFESMVIQSRREMLTGNMHTVYRSFEQEFRTGSNQGFGTHLQEDTLLATSAL